VVVVARGAPHRRAAKLHICGAGAESALGRPARGAAPRARAHLPLPARAHRNGYGLVHTVGKLALFFVFDKYYLIIN